MLNKKNKNQDLKKLISIKEMNKETYKLIFKRKKAGTNNKVKKTDVILKLNKILIKIRLLIFF